jgi:hypothetical protein
MNDDTEDTTEVKPFGGHFLVRKMDKEVKDAIVFYGRSQGTQTHGMLTAMLHLYEDVMVLAKRPEGASARLLLQRQGLSPDKPLLPTPEEAAAMRGEDHEPEGD